MHQRGRGRRLWHRLGAGVSGPGFAGRDDSFTLVAEDVTPAPYNRPPYTAAGDTSTDGCTVTGLAP